MDEPEIENQAEREKGERVAGWAAADMALGLVNAGKPEAVEIALAAKDAAGTPAGFCRLGSCVRQVLQFDHGFGRDFDRATVLGSACWNKLADSWTAEPPFVPARVAAGRQLD